jgi:triosephosphate isomerase (TIM)
MRRTLIAGNWKMHTTLSEAKTLAAKLAKSPASDSIRLIIPPFPYLSACAKQLVGSDVLLGAQTLSENRNGAFTGEVSAEMLIDLGCRYVLVGHSERRQYQAESNELVARKALRALGAGLTPIICVGEKLEHRQAGETEKVIGAQFAAVLNMVGREGIAKSVVAYEPVWAIGTGQTASPEQAQAAHAFLRSQIAAIDANLAGLVQILYGGSVKGANASGLISMPDIDGALVGGAALNAEEFNQICQAK